MRADQIDGLEWFLNSQQPLKYPLTRNLITQSRGERFRKYINKLQVTTT